jgi:hypothetical protein
VIINLTQHDATPDQVAAGVVDLRGEELVRLRRFLTFEEIPSSGHIDDRAISIAHLAIHNGLGGDDGENLHAHAAMIGGAPYLMASLERELRELGVDPIYAFSLRQGVEEKQPDGSVKKTQVFSHMGFVTPPASR